MGNVNTLGRAFRLTAAGESRAFYEGEKLRSEIISAIVDGCPAGLPLSEEDIQPDMDRRKPGQSKVTTSRKEDDIVTIHSGVYTSLSGVHKGKTTGAPILLTIKNTKTSTPDDPEYALYKEFPRPGHADMVYDLKYGGFQNPVHGGRASARTLGAAVVMGGGVAKKLLRYTFGTEILAHTIRIEKIRAEPVQINESNIMEYKELAEKNKVRCLDAEAAVEMENAIEKAKNEKDSVGGFVEVVATKVPQGLGEPLFGKLRADLALNLYSINAVCDVHFGIGPMFAEMRGSEVLESYKLKGGKVVPVKNYFGGMEGGISTGAPIVAKVYFHPTYSIPWEVDTVNLRKKEEVRRQVVPEGAKHDPCIVPRAIPIVEAMVALALADHGIISGYIERVLGEN